MLKTDPKNKLPFDKWLDSQCKKFENKQYKQKARIADVKSAKELSSLLKHMKTICNG